MLDRLDSKEGSDELDKLSISSLLAIFERLDLSLEKSLGENKEKDQHLTVLIMEQVRQRSSQKIDNVEDIDPTKEFPTIDVQAIDVTPAALKDRVK